MRIGSDTLSFSILNKVGGSQMILVTGSTGLIGSELLRRLSQAGVPTRALTRDLKKSREVPGITWVAGDLGKPETLRAAFEGTKTLFLLTHYLEDMVALQHNAIAAARAAGVTHVVKVSAFAASDHSKAPIGGGTITSRRSCRNRGWHGRCSGRTISCRIFSLRPSTSSKKASSTRLPETARFLTSMAATWQRSPSRPSSRRDISARNTS